MLIVSTIRDIQIYRISVEKDYKYEHVIQLLMQFNTISMIQKPEIINICMSAYNGYIYALATKSLMVIDINKNKII